MKIEKYESQTKINPSLDAAPASAGALSAPGKEVEGVGQTLSAIGQKMTEAQSFQERTAASNKARGDLADLVFKAKSDPDPKNHDKYIQQISKIRDGAVRGVSLRSAKSEFEADFGSMSNAALMDIKQDQRAKIVDMGLASMDGGLKQMASQYAQTGDPARQRQLILQMNSMIDEGAARGFVTADAAQKMKDKNYAAIGIDKFYADLSSINTPEGADQLLTALRKGYYEQNGVTIDPEKKKTMYEQAEKYRDKFDKETKAAQEITYDQNNRKAMLEMFQGQLTLSELQRRYTSGEIKESDYNTLERKIVTPDYELLAGNMREGKATIHTSNPELFNGIRQAQLEGAKTPGQIDRMIAAGSADGKITNQDAAYLTNINATAKPALKDKQILAAASSVKDWATRYLKGGVMDSLFGGKEKAAKIEGAVNEFYRRVDEANPTTEEDIQKIGRLVIQDNMKRDYPELGRMEDVPHVVVDVNGKVQKMLAPTTKTGVKARYKLVPVKTQEPQPKDSEKK